MKQICVAIVGLLALGGCSEAPEADQAGESVRVIRAAALNADTAQTKGMHRAAAIDDHIGGANNLWVGRVEVPASAISAPHHHGATETVAYVVSGQSRTYWGDSLENVADARPGDFVYIPPYTLHQEMNAADDAPLVGVVIHDNPTPVVVKVEMDSPHGPGGVPWVDHMHGKAHQHGLSQGSVDASSPAKNH